MNSLRAEDIYCDAYSEKTTTTARSVKSFEPTSRPVKPRKKEHRRCMERRTKIRRNLFGPVDHENTENFLKRELDILSDLSNSKWNFDFNKGKPLDGQWQWESVGLNDPTIPSAYRGTLHVEDHHQVFTKCETQKSGSEALGSLILGIPSDRTNFNVGSRNSSPLRIRPNSVRCSESRDVRRKGTPMQPTIKGFLTVKKRKMSHHQLDKNCKGKKDNPSPTFLQIIKSVPVSPTKSFVCKDNVAL